MTELEQPLQKVSSSEVPASPDRAAATTQESLATPSSTDSVARIAATAASAPFKGTHHRLRLVHSALGVGPLLMFATVHLAVQATAWQGRNAYASATMGWMSSSAMRIAELVLVIIPLMVHGAIGVWLFKRARYNVRSYPFSTNWMFTAQRVTGPVALVFIVAHAAHLWLPRVRGLHGPENVYDVMASSLSSVWLGVPWVAVLYTLGSGVTLFHAVHGLFRFLVRSGIVEAPARVRTLGLVCIALGVVTLLVSINTVTAIATGGRLF